MSKSRSLIAELDANASKASSSQHLTMLRRVTDLFVNGAESVFANDHVAVFDDVMGWLIDKIEKAERPALAELSGRLAPIDNAPATSSIAWRVTKTSRLPARFFRSPTSRIKRWSKLPASKGEKHLAAIAGTAADQRNHYGCPGRTLHGRDRTQGHRQQRRQPFRDRLRQTDQPRKERQRRWRCHRKQKRSAA